MIAIRIGYQSNDQGCDLMQTLCEKIQGHSATLAEGTLISAKELLHLGKRAAVDQALSRLVRRGDLFRVQRGLYVRPVETRFGRRAPATSRVIGELLRLRGEIIVLHPAAVANALGLTTQVPLREVYLTSGPSRLLKIGRVTVELQHAPLEQLSAIARLLQSVRQLK